MSLSRPERLQRRKEIARLVFRSGRGDLVARAGLDEVLPGEDAQVAPGASSPGELPADLEKRGPAFIKLAQVLFTRADLLHDDAHRR